MSDEPRGRVKKLSDEELRREFYVEGLTKAEIARKYEMTAANVSQRLKKLEEKTVAAVVAPEESKRYASHQIDAMGELTRSLRRVNLLMDACEEWLLDPETGKYDLSPRSSEVMVHYTEEEGTADKRRFVRKKEFLDVLLGRLEEPTRFINRSETKIADPRELILKTTAEARQTVNTLVELGQLLASLQSMERYREHFLAILEGVDPDVAQALVEAVRRDLLLNPAFAGSAAVLTG